MRRHNMLTALVDGDILLYRSANACAKVTYSYVKKGSSSSPLKFRYIKDAREALGDDINSYVRSKRTVLDPPENCIYSIKNTLKRIMEATHAVEVKIFIGGPDNFRDALDPEYKAGRPPKPAYYQLARDYLEEFCGAEVVSGMEVDDALAMNQDYYSVICSIDKDLLQVPGAHYNWVKDSWDYVTKEEGDKWFWIQMLTGDGVDNIQGIDGIGIKKAVQLVQMFEGNLKQVRSFVSMVYEEELSLEKYRINAQLLYIKRNHNHDSPPRIFTEVV